MSKGKRMQQRHVHVNKYAKFSKAEGAQERLQAEIERDQQRAEERRRVSGAGGSFSSYRFGRPRSCFYYLDRRESGIFGEYDFYNPNL